MNIVPLTEDLYEKWDDFCLQSDDAWFWHTTDWLEYTIHLRPELKSKNKSFIIMNNNIPVAICPLILNTISEKDSQYNIFSFDRESGISPALKNSISLNQRNKISKYIFNYVDKLALELDVKKTLFKISLLSPANFKECRYNHLMKFGFLNTTLNTQIINLSNDLNQIQNDMRKAHRYDIHRAEKVFEVNIFDKNNINKEIFNQYRFLHHKTAGRVTRSLITFDMMYEWILKGNAILCGILYKGKYVGFSLINIYKDGAFYSSASDDPEVETSIPISHVMQWKIINWLKKNGFRIYEIGLQQFTFQLYDFPSEKDKTISFFKRGFGGFTVSVFSGEKFYSKEFFIKIMSDRIEKYKNEIH